MAGANGAEIAGGDGRWPETPAGRGLATKFAKPTPRIGFNTVPFATFKTEISSSPVRERVLVCVQPRPEPSPGTTMKRFASLTVATFAAAATMCMASNSARAHPHVWITAKVEVIFSASVATAIRHRWTFDPGYSAYVTQGLAKNADGKLVPDELLQLAEDKDAVTLENAPKGCAATLTRPKPLEVTKQQPLSESFFNALTSASNFR